MNKISLALKSRTFWTVALVVLINTVNANSSLMGPHTLDIVNTILGLLITYFHVNPSQVYNK